MPDKETALGVARSYHRAWTSGEYEAAGGCLADQITLEVPINSYSTKEDFLQAVRRTREMTSRLELLAEFGNENDALLLYDMTLPFGVMRVAEHFTVSDGQITRIRQVHDTAVIRAALGLA